jgi:hypothetical protein
MIVAGGVYVEKCVAPERVQLLGSGGRAALALRDRRRDIHLHTFHPVEHWPDLEANFVANGVGCTAHPSSERIVFSYLFPLGRPVRTPDRLAAAADVAISGKEVLSFGCVEGRFIVSAEAAVYDPQGDVSLSFGEQGSRAKRLAIVLNADEALTLSGASSLEDAACELLRIEEATVVVVKNGPMGALVVTGDGCSAVPAYHSKSLYKIGSGDIFSASFAERWLAGAAALDAADQASRQTAAYVEVPVLPLPALPPSQRPRLATAAVECIVVADQRALSSTWQLAIVIEAIEHLGVPVIDVVDIESWLGREEAPSSSSSARRVLIIAPDAAEASRLAQHASKRGSSPVIFVDASTPGLASPFHHDLSQALYELCWATG